MNKLSNVVDNDVVKETAYDKWFTKVNAIDTVDLFQKHNIALIN